LLRVYSINKLIVWTNRFIKNNMPRDAVAYSEYKPAKADFPRY